jgi:two-component system OmpR family sensor kinase/two-component system phosphate regulon sensor histidine kinase PhoR
VDKYISQNNNNPSDEPSYEISVQKNNKIFSIKCIIFHDDSFEILINDITKPAKRKLLKQQLTDNIAHELKTPVSSIRGFLEILVNRKIETQKQNEFIRKAYAQSCRLTDLIEDISLLTKIEESSGFYKIEKINLYQIISDVVDDLHLKIIEHTVSINVKIPETLELNANATLLYSVFRNLLDNTIAYAGNNLTVTVEKYTEDAQFCYFSFSDNGIGVPEQDLSRLFERFYRVDKGRDRKSGGTGLGLAIVKNAVLFHKGEISIKNRNEGGLEFLFSLNKNLETISDSAKSI